MFAIPEQRDPIPKTGKFLTLALAQLLGGRPRGPGRGSLGENWVYHTAVIIWTQLGPVAGNERVSSWKIPDARLHTTETETETTSLMAGAWRGV